MGRVRIEDGTNAGGAGRDRGCGLVRDTQPRNPDDAWRGAEGTRERFRRASGTHRTPPLESSGSLKQEFRPPPSIVIKIGETRIDRDGVRQMLKALGVSPEGSTRFEQAPDNGETLIELAGRICYESFEVGLNPNVTRIRLNPKDYFENLLRKGDGSVAEHAVVSFVLIGVSRIMTHELVRHRVGIAVSQESLRYVRPKDLKFWVPDELSPDQSKAMKAAVEEIEEAYRQLEATIPWDRMDMDHKKRLTSAIRRILQIGRASC